jgi:hypothetical protein
MMTEPIYCMNVYIIHCVGNLTEEKSFVSMSEFPSGILTPGEYGK